MSRLEVPTKGATVPITRSSLRNKSKEAGHKPGKFMYQHKDVASLSGNQQLHTAMVRTVRSIFRALASCVEILWFVRTASTVGGGVSVAPLEAA
jgi:hypothetical protein